MTLDEFRNLKVGDEIVYRDVVYKCNVVKDKMRGFEEDDVGILSMSLPLSQPVVMVYHYIKAENILRTSSMKLENISLNIPEKEKIQNQIKLLQDKLKELEKNDVENVVKTLVPGDFIEVYYKELNDQKPYIYEVRYLDNSKIGIYSYKIENSWPIVINSISKIIVRKDIKEAYEKFLSLIRSNP